MTVNSLSIIWKGKMETRNYCRQKEFVNHLKEFEGNEWRSVLFTHVKLKVVPVNDQAPRHEDEWEMEEVQLHAFLSSELHGGELSASDRCCVSV